jgi:oxazoline/thiazoline synthase
MEPADLMLVSFKGHLRVETVPAEAVCLISEHGVTALSGPSIERLAPLLDGTRTVDQVKQELSADLSAADVEDMLARLAGTGLITYFRAEDNGHRDDEASAYWSLAGVDARHAASALAASPIELIVTGRTDRDAVAAACRTSGLTVVEPGSDAAFSLVLCDDYLDPELKSINADHLASRRPWLLARPSGAALWIGPVFRPGTGPCWTCLAKRLEGNRPGSFLQRAGRRRPALPQPTALPASRAAGLQITLLEASKWLAGIRHDGQLGVYILDTLTMRGAHHRVTRRPQCPSCGKPGLVPAQAWKPVTFVPRPIAGHSGRAGDEQDAFHLQKILETYGHLVDPVTGIVGELRRDPKCPEFLSAYQSGRNRAMAQSSVAAVRAGLRMCSGGKGVTELEAKVSALGEGVERYCATLDGDELTIRDSYRGLGDQAVHPNACQLYDDRQFADRARWNAVCAAFHRVPEPFDEQAVTDWTPVWSLLTGEHKLLPTGLLYFKPDALREPISVRADSNGTAAGGSLEDAILRGFFELVERDSVALWWYNRTCHPAVSLDSFDDDWVADLPGKFGRVNREVWVLDITSDLGIPVMAAISRRTDKAAEDIMLGFGAHFDPRKALRQALTELGQGLAAVAEARSDGTGYLLDNPHLLAWCKHATIDNQRYLCPDPARAPLTAVSYGYRPCHQVDLSRVCAITRDAGLDILVLDQTRPDIEMPVVRVVIPGLRHFWPRFAPGRLYDVPVRLGRLAKPKGYADLNPIPVYL